MQGNSFYFNIQGLMNFLFFSFTKKFREKKIMNLRELKNTCMMKVWELENSELFIKMMKRL